ncbi:MAG: RluA family pseudouridine synthase [Firmicutes bacterium]|nr:RluA family pseudouridine synthase [Bacillota bacterium]
MKEVTINANDAGQRLDKFLTKYLANMPQSMLYKSLRKNCVRVNGAHIRDGKYMLRAGDVLRLYLKDEFFEPQSGFAAGNSDIDVVYEDENIILINKESGIVVHSDDNGTEDTLLGRMQSYLYKKGEYNPENEHSFAPAFANRLDRNTSGIIIGAKNAAALRIINEKIRSREIKKLYLCVADGRMEGSGTLTAYLERGEKKVSVTDTLTANSKNIKTKYTVIASLGGKSLVEVELETGRTHQIRAQLAHIGHPLSGDKKYGSRSGGKMKLTSYKLRFDFRSDAGILNYLSGREFQIEADFSSTFLTQNS